MARENIITTKSSILLILPLCTMIRAPGKQPWQIAVSVDRREASSQDSTDSRDCIERIASICFWISSLLRVVPLLRVVVLIPLPLYVPLPWRSVRVTHLC